MSRTTLTLAFTGVALAAAAAGCAAGLLLAPASGTETRRRMSRRLTDSREDLSRACERVINSAVTAAREELERRMSCAEDAHA